MILHDIILLNRIEFATMGREKRYRDTPEFFSNFFDGRVQKISVDGGFTCPNRDGTKGVGGCVFCNNDSFSPGYCRTVKGITEQIEEGIRFFGTKYKNQKYLAYFQPYSNTYAPLGVLKQRYGEALAHPKVEGLVIATRPDTVDEEILDYLQTLASRHYICIEYGIESINDAVLERIKRGHRFAEAEAAIRQTAGRGIHIGAHLIFGLPDESRESMLNGAIYLSNLPVEILKLHQIQIVRNTLLATEFEKNPEKFRLYTLEEYLDFVTEVIERINPDVYLERFVNQTPPEYLIAPHWKVKNYEFAAKLDKQLQEKDIWQGKKHLL